MTTVRSSHARAGSAGFRVAGLLVAASLALAGPAAAQSAKSAIDQPTAGTLPPGTSTVKGSGSARDTGNGQVAPPSAIQSSTDVMQGGGSVQSKTQGGTTDPIKHLPKDMR